MSDEIEQVEQAMAMNRSKLTHEVDQIARNQELTPDAKRAKTAELRDAARDRHEQLIRAHGDAVQATRDRLYRAAFTGRPIAATEHYRALYAQADDAPDVKALEKLAQRAQNTDDSTLAAAVMHNAFDRGYHSLLGDAPGEVKRLVDFDHEYGRTKASDPDARSRQLRQRLARSVRLTAPV